MITSSDKTYIETKLVKQGKKRIDNVLNQLIDWTETTCGVRPINICYEVLFPEIIPRLEFVFEDNDSKGNGFFSSHIAVAKENLNIIVGAFKDILSNTTKWETNYITDNMFVISSVYMPIAIEEALQFVSRDSIKLLENKYAKYGLWKIDVFFSTVTCFLHTDKQKVQYWYSDTYDQLKLDLCKLIKAEDKFDFIKFSEFRLHFDSKENLDANYEGSLYRYYR